MDSTGAGEDLSQGVVAGGGAGGGVLCSSADGVVAESHDSVGVAGGAGGGLGTTF